MKIGVCSLAYGEEYKKVVSLCTESLRRYCDKHDYSLIMDETLVDHTRDYMWSKVKIIQHYLSQYEYIVWVDGDMLIMNDTILLEDLIHLYLGNKEMMMSMDVGGWINTGFWVIKNSPYNERLLDIIYNAFELAGNFHEQGVFNALYNKNIYNLQKKFKLICEVEQRLFNASNCNYVNGDFIFHFLGFSSKPMMNQYIEKVCPFQKPNEDLSTYGDRMIQFNQEYGHIKNHRYISSPPQIKIMMCTFFMGDKYSPDVIKYGLKSLKEYATKHNYDLRIEQKSLDENLPPHWSKILLLKDIIDKHRDIYDYVVWVDADVLIMNHEVKIEDIIKKYMNGKDFLLSRDISNEINTGVWIVKCTEYASSVLELNHRLPELRYRQCEDQDVFNRIYQRNMLKLQEHSTILSSGQQNIMNGCVGLYKYGDWLIHFFSLSKVGLKDAFNKYYLYKRDEEEFWDYLPRYQHFIKK
jgi:lipopolysaccharide biosynthesis glycosyltransferase